MMNTAGVFGKNSSVNSARHFNRNVQYLRHNEKQLKSEEVENPLLSYFDKREEVEVERRRCQNTISSSQQENPKASIEKHKDVDEYVKVNQICNKTLHLITIDDHMYFCAEEIVRSFTLISNREIADKVLHMKKFPTNYRILTKPRDEKVINAIKNTDLTVHKGKSKKLKIYLLPVADVVPLLQALGCRTKTFEKDFKELELLEKERINRRKREVS